MEGEDHPALVAGPLRWPNVDLNDYLEPGPIARALGEGDGRYLSWIQPDAAFNKGYLFTRERTDWPALLIGRSVLFEVDDVLGYSLSCPATGTTSTPQPTAGFLAAVLQLPTLTDLRLLGARYPIAGITRPPPRRLRRTIETEGAYRLVEIDDGAAGLRGSPGWW
jgi:hypothetical protein